MLVITNFVCSGVINCHANNPVYFSYKYTASRASSVKHKMTSPNNMEFTNPTVWSPSVRPSGDNRTYRIPYKDTSSSTRTSTVRSIGNLLICKVAYSYSRTVPNPAREKNYEYEYRTSTNTGRSRGRWSYEYEYVDLPACLRAPCIHACLPPCMASFLMPACKPCMHAFLPSFLPPACLPACLPPAFLHACLASFLPSCVPYFLHACLLPCMPACSTGACLTFEIRLGFVRDSFGMPAFLPASLQVVRYWTALHVDTGALIVGRGAFGIRLGFVRESFGMPAFLLASLHACRYGSPHCRTGCVRDTFGIRLGFVRDSFGMPA